MTTRVKDAKSKVAIKVLDKHRLEDQMQMLMQEVHILNKLDHPNIVNYFETYDDHKYIYLVMEYIHGLQLFDKIATKANNKFSEKEAASYIEKILQAINHCHAQGVIHRDIKPENIMVTDKGSVRLIDFGLAKITNLNKSSSSIAGTPLYMAPEVLDG